MPESFDALAVDIARFQASRVPGYARLCAARGVDPRRRRRAPPTCRPFRPTPSRSRSVFAFEPASAASVFRTSGTTLGARGAHAMRDVGTYDAAALAFGRAMLAPGLAGSPARVPVLVVGPSAAEAPDSSLAHMCDALRPSLGAAEPPDRTFFVREGISQIESLRARVRGLAPGAPAIVLATSFALVHLLDAARAETFALPPGSRVMQTGGFKGRSREVAEAELRQAVARLFEVDERSVVERVRDDRALEPALGVDRSSPADGAGVYAEPPWARVVPSIPRRSRRCPKAPSVLRASRISRTSTARSSCSRKTACVGWRVGSSCSAARRGHRRADARSRSTRCSGADEARSV